MSHITNLPASPAIGAFVVNPHDGGGDMLTDIATIIRVALKEQSDKLVSFDDDVRVEQDGNAILVDVPYAVSRVATSQFDRYPDQLAKLALEEVGLKLLAASRSTEIVWRDMQRVSVT